MATALDRVDVRIQVDSSGQVADSIFAAFALHWSYLWIFVAVFGLISGGLGWLIGGWWYGLRLEWAGARNPDPREARCVWAYVSLVSAAPSLLLALVDTYRFDDYLSSRLLGDWLTLIPVLALFWSAIVTYRAATTRFVLQSRPARLWFLILPFAVHGLAIGLGIVLALNHS